ncbi:MAG: hypothetical protein VZS12_06830 [Ruminococcus bromii]|nr:hypothetical protein [Ruminococcus bromii]
MFSLQRAELATDFKHCKGALAPQGLSERLLISLNPECHSPPYKREHLHFDYNNKLKNE